MINYCMNRKRQMVSLFLSILTMSLSGAEQNQAPKNNETIAPKPVAWINVLSDRLEMITKPGCYYEQPIAKKFIRQDQDKYVLHLDLPSRNFLPPEIADPGDPGTKSSCPAGNSCLQLPGNKSWQSPPIPVKHKYTITKKGGLIFSAYVHSAIKSKASVTLSLKWQPSSKKKNTSIKTVKKTVSIGEKWQRIAVVFEQGGKNLDGTAQVEISSPTTIEIGGLQLEPWHSYPAYQEEPTAWMPGNTVRKDVAPATLPACLLPMDWLQGAVSLRVKVPEVFGEKVTGERTILFIARFWGGILEITTKSTRIGNTFLNTQKLQKILADGKEHNLVLTWNDKQARFFVDGKQLSQAAIKKPPKPDQVTGEGYRIWIGTHNPRRRTVGGNIRDLRFFDKSLTESDLANLEKPSTTEFVSSPLISPPLRCVFRRDEEKVNISLPVRGNLVKDIKAKLTGIPNSEAKLVEKNGKIYLELSFQPWLCSVGKLECAIELIQAEKTILHLPWSIDIVSAEARDRYTVGNWGSRGNKEALLWAKDLGLGLVNSRNISAAYLNQVGRMGLRASALSANIRKNPHPATDARLESMKLQADRQAKAMAPFPWVTSCIHNSEGGGTDNVKASPTAMAALKKDLGLDEPLLAQPKGRFGGLSGRPKVNLKAFTETGIVPDDYLPLRYIKWLLQTGDGMNLASSITANAIRTRAPRIKMIQEPARAYYASWADTLSNWRYANSPAPMLTKWRMGLGAAQATGKDYYPLTGHCYFSPRIFLGDDQKIAVPPSGDMAAAFLWTGLAMPAKEVRCFGWWHKDWAKQEKLRPGSDARIKKAIAEISRLGPVVGNVPLRPARLAVFMSETNRLGRANDEWWHTYYSLIYHLVNFFGENDLPVDFIYEKQILTGDLKGYKYLYIPILRYQLESVNQAIREWREKGGKLILDNQANPAFKADINAPLIAGKQKGIMRFEVDKANSEKWVKKFRKMIKPYARLEKGKAIVMTKECPGTKFVLVINNKWEEALPGKKLTGKDTGGDIINDMKEFKEKGLVRKLSSKLEDIGVKQTVTVSLLENPDAAVYDLRAGKLLKPEKGPDERLQLQLPLLPGSAAVLAIYPQQTSRLIIDAPGNAQPRKISDIGIQLLGANGNPLPGRQGVEVKVFDSKGRLTDASAVYRLENGQTSIPLRLPLDAPLGNWKIQVREMASSLKTEKTFEVKK